MRQICYSVAMSLDGYIAGPKDEIDRIIVDPEIDFRGFMDRFDTILMGRKTFEAQLAHGGDGSMPEKEVIVVSRTLNQEEYPDATIVGDGLEEVISRLRVEPGKDIWLFGGGALFRSMLEAQLVDIVEVAVIPVLLGAGTPFLPAPGNGSVLRLIGSRVYEQTGTVFLEYSVERNAI
jgi:dihydrofolate reductase